MRPFALLLTACWSSPAPSKPTDAPPFPATVAQLFEQGAKWTFPTTVTRTKNGDHGQPTSDSTVTTGTLTCEIVEVAGWKSRLACTASPALPNPLPAELIASPSGLWVSVVDEPVQLIAEPPKVHETPLIDPSQALLRAVASHHGDRWCFGVYGPHAETTSQDWSICVRHGKVVGGFSRDGMLEGFGVHVAWGDYDAKFGQWAGPSS